MGHGAWHCNNVHYREIMLFSLPGGSTLQWGMGRDLLCLAPLVHSRENTKRVAVWLSGNALASMSVVAGWVIVCG